MLLSVLPSHVSGGGELVELLHFSVGVKSGLSSQPQSLIPSGLLCNICV